MFANLEFKIIDPFCGNGNVQKKVVIPLKVAIPLFVT
jgi:hypothetical protein